MVLIFCICAVNVCLREWVICMAVRLAGEWLLDDLACPWMELGHMK